MKRQLIGTALGVVLSTTAAHAVKVIDYYSMVTVTDPSNGEQFRLSQQAAGDLARTCGDDVTCLHEMVRWLAENPPYISLPGFPLARLPQRPVGNVDDDLRRKECEFAINHHQDLVQHCGFSP